jgi:chaperonin cofactor prefoldin
MAGSLDERVDRIETKLDELSHSLAESMARVDEAFLEQRQYIEFAFDHLRTGMHERFAQVDGRFERLEGRLERLEGGFERVERKLDKVLDRLS